MAVSLSWRSCTKNRVASPSVSVTDMLRLRRSPTYLPRPTDRATETDRIRQGKSRREKPARVASAVLAPEAGHLALLSSGVCSGEGGREGGRDGGRSRKRGRIWRHTCAKRELRAGGALKTLELPRINLGAHGVARTHMHSQAEEEFGDSSA